MTCVVNFIFALSQLQAKVLSGDGLVGGNPTMNTPRLRRGGGIASSSFIFHLYWCSYIVYCILFVTQLPSLERWALLPFWGFSYPNFLLVFYEPVIFRNLYHIFSQVLGLSLGLFILFLFYFSVRLSP